MILPITLNITWEVKNFPHPAIDLADLPRKKLFLFFRASWRKF